MPGHSAISSSGKTGLSRVELLFLAGVVVVLAAVAVGPMQLERQHGRMGRGVESAHTLNTLLAQYATDNNGIYPVGEGTRAERKSEGIALDLLLNNYTPNADVFAVGSTPRYRGTAKDYADLAPENLSWDFTAGANATTGITAAAPDLLPVLYTTGETVDYQPGKGLTLSGQGPFGARGIITADKAGDVAFRQPLSEASPVIPVFIRPDLKDTGTYTQIRP